MGLMWALITFIVYAVMVKRKQITLFRLYPTKPMPFLPVIDLEYDGNCINAHTKEQLLKEIGIMHDRLKQHYGKQPIFYISKTFYHIVLIGSFPNTPLWVRDYEGKPELKDKKKMALLAA